MWEEVKLLVDGLSTKNCLPIRRIREPAVRCGFPTAAAGRNWRAVNRSHAKIRALGEQAMATLKTWRLLRKLRCSTTHITALVQAVLTLHLNVSR